MRTATPQMNLDDPLASSRVVFLHAPWLPSTEGMIGAPQLARLQDGATFTNTARGALVDEAALIAERRRVAVVAVDHPSSLRSKDQVGMNLYDSSAIAAAPVPVMPSAGVLHPLSLSQVQLQDGTARQR